MRAVLAALLVGLAALPACRSVPYTGRSQLILVPAGEEQAMGLSAYQETLKKSNLSSDPEKTAMVRRVGERIARAADKPDFKWEFNLIEDDKTVNAWCLPGGKVAVYTGLLPVAKDENGLAVVMGHEVAHALARHGSERMSQGMLANFGGVAVSVLARDKPAAAQNLYAQAYGLGVGLGVLLPYSRSQESEADRIGLILMAKAGYDPVHAIEFWWRMKKATGAHEEGGVGRYLATHPAHDDRIRRIKDWIPEAKSHYAASASE